MGFKKNPCDKSACYSGIKNRKRKDSEESSLELLIICHQVQFAKADNDIFLKIYVGILTPHWHHYTGERENVFREPSGGFMMRNVPSAWPLRNQVIGMRWFPHGN